MASPAPSVADIVSKPALTMGEAAVVAGLSVKATRRLVEAHADTEEVRAMGGLVDKSRPRRWFVRTRALLHVVGETHAGIFEREQLGAIVRRLEIRYDDLAETTRGLDRRVARIESTLRTARA